MISFSQFEKEVVCKNQRIINERRGIEACEWFWNDIELCHNRTFLNHSLLPAKTPGQKANKLFRMAYKPMTSIYWANHSYNSVECAKNDAKKYGGIVEKEFYCSDENPFWFIIFDDLDRLLKYAHEVILPFRRAIQVDSMSKE